MFETFKMMKRKNVKAVMLDNWARRLFNDVLISSTCCLLPYYTFISLALACTYTVGGIKHRGFTSMGCSLSHLFVLIKAK